MTCSALADENHRQFLVLHHTGQLVRQLAQRNVLGTGDVAGGELRCLTNIDHHRLFLVDELHGARGRQRAAGGTTHGRPQQQGTRAQRHGDQHPVIENEFHVVPCFVIV